MSAGAAGAGFGRVGRDGASSAEVTGMELADGGPVCDNTTTGRAGGRPTGQNVATAAAVELLAAAPKLSAVEILDLIDRIDLDRIDREVRAELWLVGRRAWSAANKRA